MITRNLLISLSWICLIQGKSLSSQKVQFFPTATSFTRRTDQFLTSPKFNRFSNIGDDFFSNSSPEQSIDVSFWEPNHQAVYHHNSLSFAQHYNGHITPDYSSGLSYPDPFLLTGIQAKRAASYIYSKELFFHSIPHVKGLQYNQVERRRNGLVPHNLGSLRLASPWFRF